MESCFIRSKPVLQLSHGPILQALEHIAAASDPTASHNCWALKVAGSARSNDDGEPGGTGGCANLFAKLKLTCHRVQLGETTGSGHVVLICLSRKKRMLIYA